MTDTEPATWTDQEIVAIVDEELVAGSSLEQLVRHVAARTGATIGVQAGGQTGGRELGYDALGRPVGGPGHRPPTAALATAATGAGVWVDGPTSSVAALLAARLAVAIGVIERWAPAPRESRGPLELLLDGDEATTAYAVGALGLSPEATVRVLLCSGPDAGVAELVAAVTAVTQVRARALVDDRHVLLLSAPDDDGCLEVPGVPVGVRAAYGRVHRAAEAVLSYRNACDAFRFTLPSVYPRGPYEPFTAVWINGASLSGLAALCRLRREDIELVPEVALLDRLAEKYGDQVLRVLEAYAATESMRRGAAQVHMHHNSIRYWVQRIEADLGYSLVEPYRRAQLYLSLCLRRLLHDGSFDDEPRADAEA